MNTKKIIGIWGYGKVGKALVTFWTQKNCTVYVMDKNKEVEKKLKNDFPEALFFQEPETPNHTLSFFTEPSSIYVSPGIDIRHYYPFLKDTLKTEIDLFFSAWLKPIIAITGSVGKTTITSFLSSLLRSYGIAHATGGNIGTPMLELINIKTMYAVLELSSFQLEYSTDFYPTIAVWTNFYPNHLDRHTTEEAYFKAKYQILMRQTCNETAIVPSSIIPYFNQYGWPKSNLYFIADEEKYSKTIVGQYPIFTYKNNSVYVIKSEYNSTLLCSLDKLPTITICQNWLFLIAILYVLDLFNDTFIDHALHIIPIAHRTEFVTTINSLTFINDSKSTTIASTLAAVKQYKNNPVILILGGLSKGVDRSVLFKNLPANIAYILTFGHEAFTLANFCKQHSSIEVDHTQTLDETIVKAINVALPNSIILFSPSGSSYDLYNNYEERGNHFKNIVLSKKKSS